MSLERTFRDEINRFLTANGMSPSSFGKLVMNDPSFVFEVNRGRSVSVTTADRVRRFIDDYHYRRVA